MFVNADRYINKKKSIFFEIMKKLTEVEKNT